MAGEQIAPRGNLMQGKRGLIMGVANDHSIAWGIAQALASQGAQLAFTYQGEALSKRVKPLAERAGSSLVMPCDVEDSASITAAATTTRVNHLLSAGTTYHGAPLLAVFWIISS